MANSQPQLPFEPELASDPASPFRMGISHEQNWIGFAGFQVMLPSEP
jgi:hypothetical protein